MYVKRCISFLIEKNAEAYMRNQKLQETPIQVPEGNTVTFH